MNMKITFNKAVGVKVLSHKKGYCKVKLDLKPFHLNSNGIAHGGVITALSDITLAGAVDTVMKKEEFSVTAELNIQFINPALPNSSIFGSGKVIKRGKNLAFVEGAIETKDEIIIAKATGIWVIKQVQKVTKTVKRMD